MNDKILKEALLRIEILEEEGMLTDLNIKDLIEKGKLCVSELKVIFEIVGVILPIEAKSMYNKAYVDNKNEFKSLMIHPYFALAQNTSFGLLVSFLYVSDYEKQWEYERECLRNHRPLAWVYNINDETGEIGTIHYKMFAGDPGRLE